MVLQRRIRLEPAEELAERRHRARERPVLDSGAAAIRKEGADRLRVELAHVSEAGGMTDAVGEPITKLAPVAFVSVDCSRAGVAYVHEMIAPAGKGCVEIAGEGQLTALVHGVVAPSRCVARCDVLKRSAVLVNKGLMQGVSAPAAFQMVP